MVNIVRTRRNSSGGSPRANEVGEIDTKAPFQSVRAALSLFGGESSSTSPKPKPTFIKKSKTLTEGALDKEAQYHLAITELNKLKDQVRGAESTKAETTAELNKAKITLDELKSKLQTVSESKKSILEFTEVLKSKASELEDAKTNNNVSSVMDKQKQEYKSAVSQLDAKKRELGSARRDFNAVLESKNAALRTSEEAVLSANARKDKIAQLSKQITTMQETLSEIKASSKNAVLEHEKLVLKKEETLKSRKLAKENTENKLEALKKTNDALLSADNNKTESKIFAANAEIVSLREQVRKTRAAYAESETNARVELETAKNSLKNVENEKMTLLALVDSLNEELERISKELAQHKIKEEQAGILFRKLQDEIEVKKKELGSHTGKTDEFTTSEEIISSLERLALQTEKSKQEARDMKRRTEELKHEAKVSREIALEKENKLSSLLKEIEDAKAANNTTQKEIEGMNGDNTKIKLSKEEYKTLKEKANESEKSAQVKVAATMLEVEALIERQKEAAKKIEAGLKEIAALKKEEDEALKSADMAKKATNAIETELQKRSRVK